MKLKEVWLGSHGWWVGFGIFWWRIFWVKDILGWRIFCGVAGGAARVTFIPGLARTDWLVPH